MYYNKNKINVSIVLSELNLQMLDDLRNKQLVLIQLGYKNNAVRDNVGTYNLMLIFL